MKAITVFSFVLASLLTTGTVCAQNYQILIDPENPDSTDEITLTVTNSACFYSSGAWVNTYDQTIEIRLHYLTGVISECLANNPDAPDFSRTIGPLPSGDYRAVLSVFWNTRPNGIRATRRFTVDQAPPVDALSDGGITGLYFNPDDDGHYVSILETRFNTLVIWNTFDNHGNQAWVYGVGELVDGRIVVADSYINDGTGFSDGNLTGLQVRHWGTIDVVMDNCREGRVYYETRLQEFGGNVHPVRADFPIQRLAYSKQLGCEEIE